MRTKTNLIALAAMATFGIVAGSAIAAPSATSDPSSTWPSTGTYGSPSTGGSMSPSAGAPSSGSTPSSGSAASAAPNPVNDAEFAKLDKEHKGYITKKDAAKNKELVKKWDTLDMNHDGKLDQAEFAQFEVAPAGKTDKISK